MAADPLPPKEPSLAEKLATDAAAAAAQKTAESMVRGAVAAVGKAAGSALDAVETMLFGKVGGAEEAVAREAEADPMQRLRDQYGVETRTAPKKATEAEKLDEANASSRSSRRSAAPNRRPPTPRPSSASAPCNESQSLSPVKSHGFFTEISLSVSLHRAATGEGEAGDEENARRRGRRRARGARRASGRWRERAGRAAGDQGEGQKVGGCDRGERGEEGRGRRVGGGRAHDSGG